jgi:hypothetical protein
VTDETERLCPSCGSANPADAEFCRECGAILAKAHPGAGRTAIAREVEGPKPPPSGASSRSSLLRWGGGLAAMLVAILVFVAALIAYQRHRAGTLPVPGEQPGTAPPSPSPVEQPTGVAPPTPSLPTSSPGTAKPREEIPAKPTASVPSETATARPSAPPGSNELGTAPAEPSPKPPRKAAAEPAARPMRRHRTGWYRVRYRTPLFESPSETAPVVTYLAPGTRIRVTRVLPGFLGVESTTGKPPGYVSSDDVLPESVAGTYP